MTQEEFNELKAAVEVIRGSDVRLGAVLHALLGHVGDLHKVRTGPEPAVQEEVAEQTAPAEEEQARPIPRRASRP